MRPRRQVIVYHSWEELPLILNLAEASILTGLGCERLRQLCKAGELPGFKVGKGWRVDKNDLQAWMNENKKQRMGA